MSLSDKELNLHRQLLSAFDEYIRHNLRWEEKGRRRDAQRSRKSLRKIMNISYLRWQELVHRMHELDVEKDNKPAEHWILKNPGLAFIRSLNAAKKRNSNLNENDNNNT